MIKAVLVDDERNALEMLEWQLHNYCPQLQVMALCKDADEGIVAIQQSAPQLVFLDIEMPRKSGFEVLTRFPNPSFEVIFTTAYDQFAIKAFKFSALDYLLKPVDADDLIFAVNRFLQKQRHNQFESQLDILLQQYKQPKRPPGKVAFSTLDGIIFVKPEDVVRCESSSNYTILHFCNRPKLVVSKTLKEVEDLFPPNDFLRVHHSHLINLQQVSRYVKSDGGFIEMSDAAQVPISRQRKDNILDILMRKH